MIFIELVASIFVVLLFIGCFFAFLSGAFDFDQTRDLKKNKYKYNVPYLCGRFFAKGVSFAFRGISRRLEIWGEKGGKSEPSYSSETESYLVARENRELKAKIKKLEEELVERMLTGSDHG